MIEKPCFWPVLTGSTFLGQGPPPISEVRGIWDKSSLTLLRMFYLLNIFKLPPIRWSGSKTWLKNHVFGLFWLVRHFWGRALPPLVKFKGYETSLVWHYYECSICWIYLNLNYHLFVEMGVRRDWKTMFLAYSGRFGIFGAIPPPLVKFEGWQTCLVWHYYECSICWIFLNYTH